MISIRKSLTLLTIFIIVVCITIVFPQKTSALADGLTVMLMRGGALKDALAKERYLTKKGFVKITALTIITEPSAALGGEDFSFIAENLSELTALDISAAALASEGIPPSALRGLAKLQSVYLPDDIISIGSRAFDGCSRLGSIDLPEGLITIGERAFANCASLTEVHIPKSVTLIGEMAFRGCKSLTGVYTDVDNTGYLSIEGVLYARDGKELHTYPAGRTGDYSVLPSTKVLPPYSFADCGPNLTGITLPSGLDTIGEYAFHGCTELTSIIIPEGVGSLEYVFGGCTSLESVMLPKSLYFIGWETFSGCKSLKEITFEGPVERIGPLAFQNCASLTDVHFKAYFPTSKIRADAFHGCSKLSAVHVPKGTAASFRPQLRGKIRNARIVEAE